MEHGDKIDDFEHDDISSDSNEASGASSDSNGSDNDSDNDNDNDNDSDNDSDSRYKIFIDQAGMALMIRADGTLVSSKDTVEIWQRHQTRNRL